MYACTHKLRDGWMDEGIDACMDGWMKEKNSTEEEIFVNPFHGELRNPFSPSVST